MLRKLFLKFIYKNNKFVYNLPDQFFFSNCNNIYFSLTKIIKDNEIDINNVLSDKKYNQIKLNIIK